jgi:hypothetical protein
MASVSIESAPKALTPNDFKSISEKYGSLAKVAKFAVVIRPTGRFVAPYSEFTRDLTYLCEVAELPGRGFMNIDVRYYGPNQKYPFQSQYEDMNLTFLCRNKSLERQFFDDWMTIINPINSYDFNYRDDYACEIDIFQFSTVGKKAGEFETQGFPVSGNRGSVTDALLPQAEYRITLHNAYPVLVNPQPVIWSDDQIQRLVVSFTYSNWSRAGLDPEPRAGEPGGFSYQLVGNRETVR